MDNMAKVPQQKPGQSKQDYATPACFIEPVKRLLGITEFAHDFAADETNAQANTWFDEQMDALSKSALEWVYYACASGWGWLNPPFSKIGPWAKQCKTVKAFGGSVAFLVPAAVGANWFRDYVHNEAFVWALNGRIPFMPDKPTWLYPKDCILCLYSPDVDSGFDVWTWR